MSRSRISVVIPLYNHEKYIETALESVLRQSVPAAEIIVVDDGSTDASADKVRALAEKNKQIIFWSQPNQGAPYTLNACIHRATGEFVSILNSDDIYCPTRLEECLKVIEQHPEVSAVATGLTFIDADSAALSNPWYEDGKSFYKQAQDLSLALINSNFFVTTSNLFVRKALFEEIGYFAPLRYTHDLDFFLRLLAWSKGVHFFDQPLLHYRIHRANTIQEDDIKVQVERAAVVAFFLYSAWSNRVRDSKDWHGYIAKLTQITDRQALGALLFYFLDYLEHPTHTALHGALGAWDSRFRRYMREAAGQPAAAASSGQGAHRHLAQNEELQKELALRDAVISDQKSWIGKLEEGKQWLAAQNDQLQKEIEKRDAMFAEQKAWIGKLEEGKQWLAARNEQLQREAEEMNRSPLWKVLQALRLVPRSRR